MRRYTLQRQHQTGVGDITDETGPAEQPITTREWIRGVLFVVILAAAVVGLGIWALVSFVFRCGCTIPA